MTASSSSARTIRDLKYLLITAVLLNGIVFAYLAIVFLAHRSAVRILPNPDQLVLIENVLHSQPAEKGRQNAIELLRNSNKSLYSTLDLVRRGFYCTASLLLANIVISAACIGKLRAIR